MTLVGQGGAQSGIAKNSGCSLPAARGQPQVLEERGSLGEDSRLSSGAQARHGSVIRGLRCPQTLRMGGMPLG